METKNRFSQKREAIYNNLLGRTDHPDALAVYESIREAYPNISLGTVYRNLNKLAQDGKILSFANDGKERFDGNIAPHCHFCCTKCGRIFDSFDSTASSAAKVLEKQLSCKVMSIEIVAKGICEQCLGDGQ